MKDEKKKTEIGARGFRIIGNINEDFIREADDYVPSFESAYGTSETENDRDRVSMSAKNPLSETEIANERNRLKKRKFIFKCMEAATIAAAAIAICFMFGKIFQKSIDKLPEDFIDETVSGNEVTSMIETSSVSQGGVAEEGSAAGGAEGDVGDHFSEESDENSENNESDESDTSEGSDE